MFEIVRGNCSLITLHIWAVLTVLLALVNSVDPDQTAPREQSDHGVHCLLLFL